MHSERRRLRSGLPVAVGDEFTVEHVLDAHFEEAEACHCR